MKIKKLKKLIAGVLSAAMVMSTMAVTAFAAGPDTINTTRTGSLTIHKYTEGSTSGSTGTGTSSDGDSLPAGAEPLAGAGFSIYKVEDMDTLLNYYSTSPSALPDVSQYVDSSNSIKSAYADDIVEKEKVTGEDGTVTFTNLPLGLYVVVETKTPDLVTDPVDAFIVSVPMTSVDGDSWLYDIHVYPKNGITTGEVTLKKTGENGALLEGVTFKLEKQNSDGSSWTEIKNEAGPAGDDTGEPLDLTTDASGEIEVSGLSQGTYRFTETSLGDSAENGGYILDKTKTYQFTVGTDGNITIPGTQGTTVTVENEKPDMTKTVQDRETTEWKNETDYNIGDTIPYRITIDVPANITQLKKFELTDTPTNLTDNVESIKITSNNQDIGADVYKKTRQGTDGFKITFKPEAMSAYADKELIITYNAVLKDAAVTTTVGNPNTASLKYSNEILPVSETGTPGEAEIKDNAVVYTFKMQIHKVDGSNNPLSGVVFDLYKEVEKGTAGAIQGNSDNGLDSEKYWLNIASNLTTQDGYVSKSGLANGTYYLVETKTNTGFNLLNEPVKVTLSIEYATSMTEVKAWEKIGDVWTLVKHEIDSTKTTFDGQSDADSVYTTDEVKIVNRQGFSLPVTGGTGTLLASLIGILLMGGGAFVFISSRKKKKAE